ncbi:UNVERIFIED_CONTAM: hypothetical protein Sangu_2518500 [Sesamum angustifolium]|uniref:Uncharacterized protein n=1 Tax=Sesamum angustifolium TaxID=2727405 RepID=A0AAW2JIT2_9LAMI
MELHKFRYLKRLLDRRNENQADRYIDAVIGMEEGHENAMPNLRDPDDPILQERTLSQLRHDIVLVENQLPFFLLNQLFIMTKSEDPNDDIISLTLLFVKGMFLNLSAPVGSLQIKKIDHLFGLIHDVWVLPFTKTVPQGNIGKNNQASAVEWDNINSASGLREAGIKFKKAKDYTSLMDIKFVGGVLRIPQLNIYYETESQFTNRGLLANFADVNKHYRRRTKKWVAKLWRDYFNSPWSILKFLAAVALLALAFLQTFYTVYSYYNPKTNSNGPPSGS